MHPLTVALSTVRNRPVLARAIGFACHSKGCAPPPVGAGGSKPGGGGGSRKILTGLSTEDIDQGDEVKDVDGSWRTVASAERERGHTTEPWSDETRRTSVPATRFNFTDGNHTDWPDSEPVTAR